VDSEVLEICFQPLTAYSPHAEERLFRVIAAAFGQRRKTLKNALSSGLQIRPATAGQALAQAGIDPARRAETLSPEEFVLLDLSLQRLAPNGVRGDGLSPTVVGSALDPVRRLD